MNRLKQKPQSLITLTMPLLIIRRLILTNTVYTEILFLLKFETYLDYVN